MYDECDAIYNKWVYIIKFDECGQGEGVFVLGEGSIIVFHAPAAPTDGYPS